jgi:hypothetical protein
MNEPITIQNPDATALNAAEVAPIVAAAESLVVTDQASHGDALLFVQQVERAKRRVRDVFEEPKRAAHAAHKAITAAETNLLAPLDEARATVQRKVLAYQAEAARIAAEEALRKAEEERKRIEEQALIDAIAAEAEGEHAAAQAILETPVVAPYVQPAPAVAKVAGVATTTRWRAEVTDLHALVRHVAAHPELLHYLAPAQPALNSAARSLRTAFAVPGVRAIQEQGMAVRT